MQALSTGGGQGEISMGQINEGTFLGKETLKLGSHWWFGLRMVKGVSYEIISLG